MGAIRRNGANRAGRGATLRQGCGSQTDAAVLIQPGSPRPPLGRSPMPARRRWCTTPASACLRKAAARIHQLSSPGPSAGAPFPALPDGWRDPNAAQPQRAQVGPIAGLASPPPASRRRTGERVRASGLQSSPPACGSDHARSKVTPAFRRLDGASPNIDLKAALK